MVRRGHSIEDTNLKQRRDGAGPNTPSPRTRNRRSKTQYSDSRRDILQMDHHNSYSSVQSTPTEQLSVGARSSSCPPTSPILCNNNVATHGHEHSLNPQNNTQSIGHHDDDVSLEIGYKPHGSPQDLAMMEYDSGLGAMTLDSSVYGNNMSYPRERGYNPHQAYYHSHHAHHTHQNSDTTDGSSYASYANSAISQKHHDSSHLSGGAMSPPPPSGQYDCDARSIRSSTRSVRSDHSSTRSSISTNTFTSRKVHYVDTHSIVSSVKRRRSNSNFTVPSVSRTSITTVSDSSLLFVGMDTASVVTIASSSKRRHRRSFDTNASTRAIAPESIFSRDDGRSIMSGDDYY